MHSSIIRTFNSRCLRQSPTWWIRLPSTLRQMGHVTLSKCGITRMELVPKIDPAEPCVCSVIATRMGEPTSRWSLPRI